MSLWEGMRIAWMAIRGNALRSFLTALGIIIGVATVIAVVSLGAGSKQQVAQAVESLGTNLVIAYSNPRLGATFTADTAADVAKMAPDIANAMPLFGGSGTLAAGELSSQGVTIDGVSAAWLTMKGAKLAAGAFIDGYEVQAHSSVVILGQTAAQDLGINSIGGQIYINGFPFTVIGLLQPLGGSGASNQDNVAVIPYTTAEIVLGTLTPQSLYFQVSKPEDADLVVGTLQMIFAHRYPSTGAVSPVTVISQNQLLSTLSSVRQTLTVTLSAIAGVSLLVGGIGIMNIMLVSIIERTREIGLRKALGAKRRSILMQFLLEAAFLSTSGGVLGIALGWGGSRIVATLMKTTTIVTPGSVLLGFCFSLLVGLVFGIWPAAQGSRLDPIVALRHD